MLDVSLALTSPFLMDVFDVVRRLEVVSAVNGRTTIFPITFSTLTGVVYPEGDNKFRRDSERQTQGKGIEVVTHFALRGSSLDAVQQSFQPDIVVWRGTNFVLDEVKDYSAYGPGFVQAHGVMIDAVALPTTEDPNMKIQQYALTIVTNTQLTSPVPALQGQSMLFRNGVLQKIPDDYTAVGNAITLVVPLGVGDTVVFYA